MSRGVAAGIEHLLRSRPRAHSLPQPFYTDPEVFALDVAAIWHRRWLGVGATCEVPTPGSYITLDIGGAPVIILRDAQGTLRGFHNTCRHRGSKLLDAPCGSAKGIVCPYHRWTYRLDGSLAWAAAMPDGFDKAAHGLRPIHVQDVGGTLFACLADTPPDLAPYAAGMAPLLEVHGLGGARIAHEETIVVQGNWKLMMENSRECYHCAAEHRDLMRYFLDVTDVDDPKDAALIRDFWARMEQDGIPSHIAEGPDFRATRLPFINGAVSTTIDGRPAVARRLGQVPHNDVGSLRWVHYPSVFNHALGDYAVLVRMLPLTPTTTEVCTKWLVAAEATEGVDYDLARLRHIWSVTNDEDARLVERNQAGVNSPAYTPGPYSAQREAGVMRFVEWYAGQLSRHLGGDALSAVA